MFTYGDFAEGRVGGSCGERAEGAARLRCAPLRFRCGLRLYDYILPFGIGYTNQHFIGGVLYARVGLVELAGCLRRKLAQHVTIAQCGHRFKN